FVDYHIKKGSFNWRYCNQFHCPNSSEHSWHLKTYLNKNLDEHPIIYDLPIQGHKYNFLNLPMGSWVYYQIQNNIEILPPKTIYHFNACSTKENAAADANSPSCELKSLEDNLANLSDLYYKYLPYRNRKITLPQVIEHKRKYDKSYPLVLITVCVYKNIKIVEKWMKQWYQDYNLYNSRIALIHNFDGDKPSDDDMSRLLALKPDYYVPRYNRGQDIGAFQDIVQGRLPYFQPNFDLLFCFADDSYPLHKDFLKAFMEVMKREDAGMCAPYTFELTVRSNAFGMKREVAEKLKFNYEPVTDKVHCLQMEVRMPQQIVESGLTIYQLPTAEGSIVNGGPFCNRQWLVWDEGAFTVGVD